MKGKERSLSSSWEGTGVYIPFSKEYSSSESKESSTSYESSSKETCSPCQSEEESFHCRTLPQEIEKVYLPCSSEEEDFRYIPQQQVEKVYIPYSPSCSKEESYSEETPLHPYVEEVCLDKDLDEIFSRIEEAGERYIKKIKRVQRTHTRLAVAEILSAKEDAIEEIKNCSQEEACEEDKYDEEQIEKLRQEMERLKTSVNMLSQVLFRNTGMQTNSF